MNQFKFEGGLKTTLLILIAIGIGSLVITYLGDSAEMHHPRFWSNILHNSVFFTGIACLGLFFLCVCITAWAGWSTLFKRMWEAYSLFLIPGLILMLIVGFGAWFGWHHMYEWADPEIVAHDKVLQGKSSFLNTNWYVFGSIIVVGLWILVANRIRTLSLKEDGEGNTSFQQHHKMRIWAAAGLPLLVSNLAGLNETVDNGCTGLLFTPGDSLDLSDKIERLLDEPDYREQLSSASIDRVRREFTLETQEHRLRETIEIILDPYLQLS